MSSLAGLGVKPPHVTADEHYAKWFAELIARLLNATDFLVNGAVYRFAELEAYYHGPDHPDLFAHRDPVQLENGRWYFHKTRGEYRGGSFKGLDLAFGDGTAHFGILIRTVVTPAEEVIDGPSLSVDHLLAQTKAATVATLDAMINSRKVWDETAPLAIREAAKPRAATVYQSSRVGLSLKKAKGKPDAPRFVARPYRFLTEPLAISKGKPHLVLALHRRGEKPETISQITGTPKKTVERYIKDFEAGKAVPNFDGYIGKELGTADLCKLLGTWTAKYGNATG
jgi:hypothetical protein